MFSLALVAEMHAQCKEPPPVPHSTRTGAQCPYYLEDQVQYSCDECYTGGGNITCLGHGKWSKRITCEGNGGL